MQVQYLNDACVWRIVISVCGRPDLSGSVLTAKLNPITGGKTDGVPIVALSSAFAAAKLEVVNDEQGKALAVRVNVSVAARNGWQADQPVVRAACDVHRVVPPNLSTEPEWLGRAAVGIVPDSGSLLLYRPNPSQQPVLIPVQPSPTYFADPAYHNAGLVDAVAVEAMQAQIAALTARLAALEAAAGP